MEALKIDRTKLKSVANYAKDNNMTRQTAYNKIKSGELKSIEIDGVIFVYLG